MRNKIVTIFLLMLFTVLGITICFADNPLIQTIYTADPAPMVYNNTLYLYTSHDEDNANTTFVMKDWRCYTTTDMVNWTDCGVILNTQQVSWSRGGAAYAGQCIARNGKFYWYFPTTNASDGQFCIGVAVANSPTGPFTDIGHPLVPSNLTTAPSPHSWEDIDPTVFVDDDGQAYMYWGNNMCYWVKLNSDMISTNGNPTNVSLTTAAFGPDYEEAPWLWKRNGKWYLAYASRIPETVEYTMSTSPTGPWTYKGQIMPVPTNSGGNHPGIIDYKGNSYFFGFNSILSSGNNYKRSICVKQFTYNSDGTIPNLGATFNSSDPVQLENLNPYNKTEAETICWESGVETESCSEGGMDVCYIENGDYIKVKGVDFGSGATSFDARVSSATSGGRIELHLDSITGTLVGTCTVSGTGGWQTWTTKSCSVSGASGKHDLYIKFTGGSGSLFNFNWWQFKSGVTTPTPTPTPTTTPGNGTTYEAETGTTLTSSTVENAYSGYTGTGYVNFNASSGAAIQWNNISCTVTGTKNIKFRYALASGTRNLDVYVNGTKVLSNISFAATNSWSTWATTIIQVTMNSGTNTLKLVTTGTEGPNIDNVTVSAAQ